MICAIVLAAGRSLRMGTQKLLLPWRGKTVITHVVDEVQCSPVQETIVVVGRDGEGIKSALRGRTVTFTANPDSHGDMLSSVRCGLRVLPSDCEAVMVAVGDQPGITGELVSELINAFQKHSGGIVVPTHGGKHGHPVVLASSFFHEILNQHDGIGLRGLLRSHSTEIFELPVPNPEALEDIDTPEEYKRLDFR